MNKVIWNFIDLRIFHVLGRDSMFLTQIINLIVKLWSIPFSVIVPTASTVPIASELKLDILLLSLYTTCKIRSLRGNTVYLNTFIGFQRMTFLSAVHNGENSITFKKFSLSFSRNFPSASYMEGLFQSILWLSQSFWTRIDLIAPRHTCNTWLSIFCSWYYYIVAG